MVPACLWRRKMLAERRGEDAILPADFLFACPMSHPHAAPEPEDRAGQEPAAPASPAPDEGLTVHPLVARLVEWRTAKGWTQERTAEHLGIPLNTLRGYECGNRNPGGANTEKILTLVGLPKRRRT